MDHFVITIRPSSDEALLPLKDAMQQVLDTVTVFMAAERSLGSPHEAFVWKLESATTNSPFTVIARAEASDPSVDVSAHVKRVKSEVSRGLRSLIENRVSPHWMGPDEANVIRGVFIRHRNGIGKTDIDLEDGNFISIDRARAEAGVNALAAINAALDVAADLPQRQAYGELEGFMVAAGRYRGQPAIQIRTELYGYVWCTLSRALTDRFGGEHRMNAVWEGKTIGVEGRLFYAAGGKLQRVEAVDIREIRDAPHIDLDSVLDPNFTAGMDPHEYLRRFHDGELS